jgi:hypothetical protein
VRGYPELKASAARVADRAEAVLQGQAEMWLRLRGYAPMHADQAGAAPRGWYAHLRRPDRVPEMQIADLLILSADMRRCVQLELKARRVYQPGQREHIAAGRWVECWEFAEVVAAVEAFEAGEEAR